MTTRSEEFAAMLSAMEDMGMIERIGDGVKILDRGRAVMANLVYQEVLGQLPPEVADHIEAACAGQVELSPKMLALYSAQVKEVEAEFGSPTEALLSLAFRSGSKAFGLKFDDEPGVH